MHYLDELNKNKTLIQKELDHLLVSYKAEPVGWGYIDSIVTYDDVENFITALTDLGIVIEGVTWWCHIIEDTNKELGCPHGMGGPKSKYHRGWYSEMQTGMYEVPEQLIEQINNNEGIRQINNQVKAYIMKDFRMSSEYMSCQTPALWLSVPDDWINADNR